MAIGQYLDDQGTTTPAAIGKALGMSADEATKLMTGRRWQEGDLALVEAVAVRLELVGLTATATAFADCRCCSSVCGVIRKTTALSGGWSCIVRPQTCPPGRQSISASRYR
ncbi:hypothetical protein [Dankookia sp. GCM10030260]|uniref:hypothetical protein n=1 Tax=Dankookia sp. GCM10030260 TaxID=3273390 RepID=UPI0036D3A802